MRAYVYILAVFLISTILAPISYAGNVEKLPDKSLVVKGRGILSPVTVSPDAQLHPDAWKEAYRNPGVNILVGVFIKRTLKGFWEIREITKQWLKYDEGRGSIEEISDSKVKETFNPFFILMLVSVFFAVILNICREERFLQCGVLSFLAMGIASAYGSLFDGIVIVPLTIIAAIAIIVATIVAASVAFRIQKTTTANFSDHRIFVACLAIYYTAATVGTIGMYFGV